MANTALLYFVGIYHPNVENHWLRKINQTNLQSHFPVISFFKGKKLALFRFIFEPKFRPEPKSQILPEMKPKPKFRSQFRPEPEPNRISVDH